MAFACFFIDRFSDITHCFTLHTDPSLESRFLLQF
jgi:hypothetical protein